MTQQDIFELLLQNNHFSNDNKNHLYPTLVPEAAETISAKLTDMIYDSLKQKSSTSASRRTNLLKFLQNISSPTHEHHHLNDDNYSCALKHLDCSYKKNDEVEEFLQKCELEVNKNKLTLYEKIINVQKTRISKQIEFNIQRDFRADRIQKKLSSLGIVCDVLQGESIYQPNESIIKKIFRVDEIDIINENDSHIQNEKNSEDYRLKQIKFGYAINNIGTKLEIEKYFDIIVHNLGSYEELYDFEKSFLKYLFKNIGRIADYSNLCNKFFFILEIDTIEMCTQIVKLEDADEVQQFFHNLSEKKEFIYLKLICSKDKYLSRKIKSVLYNLYGYSFCNVNILKFIKLLNE